MALNFIFLILFSLAFLGIGRKIFRRLVVAGEFATGEEIIFSLGLGVGFFEILGLVLGFLGLFYRELFYFLFFIILLVTLPEWSSVLRWVLRFKLPAGRVAKIMIVLIAARLVFNFLAAQAPVTEGDALWYHLTLPKIFIREHGIIDAYLLASYLPFNTEMLYAWAMMVKDEILAQSLSFLVGGVFLTSAVYLFAKRFFSATVALLAALIFIYTPVVSWESVTPSVDLFLTLWVLLGFWAFVRRQVFLGAIFLGLSLGTKGVLVFLPIMAMLPILRGWKTKDLLTAAGIAGLFFAPYLLRNLFLTGNPIFPFLPALLGAGGMDPQVSANIQQEVLAKQTTLTGFFKSFWDMSLFPQKYGPDIGGLYLIFIPIGMAVFWRSSKSIIAKSTAAFCLIFYVLWYLLAVPTSRYLLPVFPFLAILVAATALYLIKLAKITRFLTVGILVLSVPMSFLTYFWTFEPYGPKIKAALGIYGRQEYILRLLPYTEDFFWINKNLPGEVKVLLYLNPWQRTFYLDRPFIVAGNLQREIDFSRPEKIENKKQFLTELEKHAVTHVYSPASVLDEDNLEKIYQGNSGNIYRIIY